MATTKNAKETSKPVAKKAGKALADPKTPKTLRPIVASDLAQAPSKKVAAKKKSR
jgi:hypothetical protein